MADENNEKSGSIWPKVIAFILTTAVGIFTVVFAYYKLKKQGEELAKLQHEKDVLAEEKRQAEAAAKMEKNNELAKQLLAEADAARRKLADLNYQVEKIKSAQLATKEKIDAAKDWSDLDALFGNPPKSN